MEQDLDKVIEKLERYTKYLEEKVQNKNSQTNILKYFDSEVRC